METDFFQRNFMKSALSIAPMMEWTDRHYRFFMRQITKKTVLYTEMVTSGAIIFGDRKKLLDFSEEENPLVLQIGGDNPVQLAECAKIAESFGYDEINLNIGCPSERVQSGNFGACLMSTPEVVAKCVESMSNASKLPVTVKNRIGIDNLDTYENLENFIRIVSSAGCQKFIVHARVAILKGLSPKGNRTVPPLRYSDVYKLKNDFPNLIIEINGGIKTLEEVKNHLDFLDGAMIGREAYENPFIFSLADSMIFNSNELPPTRKEVIERMIPYIEKCFSANINANRILNHMLGLFTGQRGSKHWKRYLSENMHKKGADEKILLEVMKDIPEDVLNFRPNITHPRPKATHYPQI